MSTITVYLLLSLSVLRTINGQGQSCLDGFPSVTNNTCTSSSCPFQGLSGINTRQLRLFPSMRITCNGMLEGLSVAGETQTDNDYPILQIWRPTSPTSYQRISEYEFPISGCTELPNNAWQCTVSPSINVEEGDIIGIILPPNRQKESAFGIYFTSSSSFSSYILDSTSDTTFSVPGSTTASVQPVLTLDIQEQLMVFPYTVNETSTTDPTQPPTTELTTQAPITDPTQAQPTQAPTTQSETKGPTTQSTTQGPTTHQTTAVGTGQSASDTEIAGPVVGAVVGAVVGVLLLVLIVALTVGVVVYILTRRKFTDKGQPEVVSERQVVEDSQRGGISNGIHSTETNYEVIELDSQKQTTETMSSNPSYMPNTDASINYEDDMYSYVDPKNVRILARKPIVEDEIETDQHIYY